MRALLAAAAAALLLVAAPSIAQDGWAIGGGQAERILSFVSAVTIERDGTLDVTETIRVQVGGQEIQRGIQRDFPTSYDNELGQTTRVGFELVSVRRDGREEPAEQSGLGNGVRIRIGQEDVLLPLGEHVYEIRYRMTRQIRYGKTSDELYWNATGNGWTFAIDSAEARITLPSPAPFGERAVYTGPQGSTERNAAVIAERPGFIAFRTTRPLGREEGLTVAASFPKGVLEAPGTGRRIGWWLADWGALAVAIAAIAGILAYYARAWAKVGRGPRAGPVVPLFAPPDDLSAAATRYIRRMKHDNRAFTAAIVELGVRGKLKIERTAATGWLSRGNTTLRREGKADGLPRAEAAMFNTLFGSGSAIVLKQANHATLQSASAMLNNGLEGAYSGRLFADHRDWAVFGSWLVPAAMLATGWLAILVQGPSLWMALVPGIAMIAGYGCYRLTQASNRARGISAALLWMAIVAVGMVAAVAGFATLALAIEGGGWPLFLPLITLPLVLSAYWWMQAPTVEGRAVMDRIAGFRHYLGITEEARLDTLHPPEKTPELFERYLPYAIALDVENRWADRFVGVLAAAAAAGAATHSASWYAGDTDFWSNPGGFANSVGSSLASTVSSASASPSSSSSSGGSSGGGSSGGGGGGGGGSGW